ncbi:hypothetical protein GCM10009801_75420 [Streptomyces albiaxialis]|uniref:Lipoprotein n=1 Tax=Streptomyces albiaxialis TaxID=329523 RepID=A0ABN2X1D8_9ACTN
MQRRRIAVSLAALATASALVLAGCGGGDGGGGGDGKSDKIQGAGNGKKASPSSSTGERASAADNFGTADIKLPKDLKLTYDWDKPSDPAKAAALDGAADYVRAMMHSSATLDPKDPLIAKHSVPLQSAQAAASAKARAGMKSKKTVTGTFHHYRANVGDVVKGNLAEVSFCADQSRYFSKDVESGKILRTKPGPGRYLHFSLVMQKGTDEKSIWRAKTIELTTKAVKECAK